jgi:hypothetical protein
MLKIRPFSANAGKNRNRSRYANPASSIRKDLKILNSSEETGKFLDSKIFKLTDTEFVDHKSLASTQISQELKFLKSFTNKTQLSKTSNNRIIEKLAIELEKVKTNENSGTKLEIMHERARELKEKIKETKLKQVEKLEDREIYYHIEKRMIETRIFLNLKNHELTGKIKLKENLLINEKQKFFKVKEARSRSTRVYKNYDKTSAFFNKSKFILADKCAKEKKASEEMDLIRYEHSRRHREICEEVDNEETIRKFKGIREQVMLSRLWHLFLSNRLKEYLSKFGTIDLAFRKIRSITGLNDINDVVEKFLTKENLYHELMSMVNQNKANKENLIQSIKTIEEKIQELNISEKPAFAHVNIQGLLDNINEKRNRNFVEKERLGKILALKVKLESWIKKIILRVNKTKELDHFNFHELVLVLKNTVNDELTRIKIIPSPQLLYETKKVLADEMAQLGKSSFFSRLIEKEKMKNEKLLPVELDYIDEVYEHKKKSFFTPLLEKTLKRTN